MVNISDFRWSIAGNLEGKNPNILSELSFRNITSLGAVLNADYRPIKQLLLSCTYKRAYTISGSGTDTDYQSDNRTNPTYHENFTSNEGYLSNFEADTYWYFLQLDKVVFRLDYFTFPVLKISIF